ncbi:P-loop containing nucleoside triphosphate hydrolase protein [Westerdykella ornata]|uniref:P-loop containing nucleoside triphosphate hydrolase protein n=1 Tax=Westerdykella ornata TaxID=318751 RepID=A0A6A6JNT7_WESOR|nr:P-loop containing nucleoside triphosphate hydrolase protein [Westerdykella ornata]KAF2277558.1 P-loop containing nucleoside triphosphate hydrolase protein [Westerdykella ornata]
MASISIFTFDHSPPRVSSPWATPAPGTQPKRRGLQDSASAMSQSQKSTIFSSGDPGITAVELSGITKLEAEPQEGPTEYKLHLLLRRRRSFIRTTTAGRVSGSLRRIESGSSSGNRSVSEPWVPGTPPAPSVTTQSRQHRLRQLTTQLYWRLQQSCQHHVSSSSPLIEPQFPDDSQLSAPIVPQRLLPGLEESKGALYEIGVADDGTFAGLAEDEMEESINNLRAMAASLGCRVDIIRKVHIGDCEWLEEDHTGFESKPIVRASKLWVVEAFVYPDQHIPEHAGIGESRTDNHPTTLPSTTCVSESGSAKYEGHPRTQQLRVSLTGATGTGKSSLLGTLSSNELDDGRGKSRLSLLRHRHEIASGMTSSVTQELIGYRDVLDHRGSRESTQVVSYGTGDVSEWLDIHASAEGGRLVLLADSAGHPRFRRTTVRGLVGWDPHWTLLCISAGSTEDSSLRSHDTVSASTSETDLSHANLRLCLNLELPLVIVITKYDLANKPSLRQTLSPILTAIKDAGRKPQIVSAAIDPGSEVELDTVSADEFSHIGPIVNTLKDSPLALVPIVFTSAVKGTGITKLHALLRELPIPRNPTPPENGPRTLFHIEDVYSNILAPAMDPSLTKSSQDRSIVIGGHVRYGTLRVGSELLLGPYNIDASSDDSDSGPGSTVAPERSRRPPAAQPSRSFPGALRRSTISVSANEKHQEWRRVRITSIRNLRLPMRSLYAGQVGTIGVAPVDVPIASPATVRIRKGMVLADGEPRANRVITVRFLGHNAQAAKSLSVGSAVVVYVASVRASAKVVSVAPEEQGERVGSYDKAARGQQDDDDGFGFGFDDDSDKDGEIVGTPGTSAVVVAFQFMTSREFFEVDAKVLILPGGGPGLYGGTERGEKGVAALEGFVGRVVVGY